MRKLKKGNAWVLALVLLLPLLAVPKAYGAIGIDTERQDCSIGFKLDGQYPELEQLSIPVKLYRAANVEVNGSYTVSEEGAFSSLDFSSVSSETTAEEWENLAKEAADIVSEVHPAPTAEITIQKQAGQANASGQAQNLAAGMYLVEAETVQSAEYQYSFTPYLVSLPNNYYAESGDDTWVYNVETGLKPEQQERFGSLRIEKELTVYNKTLRGASFVFQVEAEKNNKTVYSDVVSLAFDTPGVKSLLIDRIPAGARVKVKELYSGASYVVVGNAEINDIQIRADEEALAHFENTYDDHPKGGSGIVNHFRYHEESGWDVVQQKDSTDNGQ